MSQFKTTTEILFRMVGKIVEQLLFFSFQNRTNLENLKKKKGKFEFFNKMAGSQLGLSWQLGGRRSTAHMIYYCLRNDSL